MDTRADVVRRLNIDIAVAHVTTRVETIRVCTHTLGTSSYTQLEDILLYTKLGQVMQRCRAWRSGPDPCATRHSPCFAVQAVQA